MGDWGLGGGGQSQGRRNGPICRESHEPKALGPHWSGRALPITSCAQVRGLEVLCPPGAGRKSSTCQNHRRREGALDGDGSGSRSRPQAFGGQVPHRCLVGGGEAAQGILPRGTALNTTGENQADFPETRTLPRRPCAIRLPAECLELLVNYSPRRLGPASLLLRLCSARPASRGQSGRWDKTPGLLSLLGPEHGPLRVPTLVTNLQLSPAPRGDAGQDLGSREAFPPQPPQNSLPQPPLWLGPSCRPPPEGQTQAGVPVLPCSCGCVSTGATRMLPPHPYWLLGPSQLQTP